jgi:uncharacterized protein YjiS (DUF1127 family)
MSIPIVRRSQSATYSVAYPGIWHTKLPLSRMAIVAGQTVSRWIARSRQRRALRAIAKRDDYLLKDIGLSQDEALREADKPFWRR